MRRELSLRRERTPSIVSGSDVFQSVFLVPSSESITAIGSPLVSSTTLSTSPGASGYTQNTWLRFESQASVSFRRSSLCLLNVRS